MKFKMAPDSLFAILLRSRWWISFVVAFLITAGTAALLPKDLSLFGFVCALPFFIVGCIAAWRQWRAPSAAQVEQALAIASAQSWKDFSAQLERAWAAEGYRVERLNTSPADFLLTQGSQITLVSARRWKAAHHGVEPLKELYASAPQHGAGNLAYISLHGLGDNAAIFARDQAIVVLSGSALATLLRKASQS